jgi:hypothetical protein
VSTVRRPVASWSCALLASVAVASCRNDAEPLAHEEIIRADLAEILVLQGATCGEIRSYEVDDHLDYRVECTSGEVFRIHVTAEGHVDVKSHGD